MRVLSGLSGFPTPTHHSITLMAKPSNEYLEILNSRLKIDLYRELYYLRSVTAPSSPAAPYGTSTNQHIKTAHCPTEDLTLTKKTDGKILSLLELADRNDCSGKFAKTCCDSIDN